MNCYICGGFLLSNDKHTVGKKVFHKNCWGRLDRKQQKLVQDKRTFEAFNKSVPAKPVTFNFPVEM